MKLHMVASQPHYHDHLRAIWKHLPEDIQGLEVIGNHGRLPHNIAPNDCCIVASYDDLDRTAGLPTIFVEHGAGQRYAGLAERVRPYYGGPMPDNVIGYVGPRQECVDEFVAQGIEGIAAGSPICDNFELYGDERTAVITFHWNAVRVCPEAMGAYPHYAGDSLARIVRTLRENDWEVLGHRHPRLIHPVNLWTRLGVTEVDAATARRRATLLISDNTSFAYEMAYLARQNICLNAPWFRRDVEHGLRFWSNPPGPMVDSPGELVEMITNYDSHFPAVEAVTGAQAAYGKVINNGHDGLRAALWVVNLLANRWLA